MTWLQWLVGGVMGVAIMGQLFFSQLMQDGGSEAAACTYAASLERAVYDPVFAFALTALALHFLRAQPVIGKPA